MYDSFVCDVRMYNAYIYDPRSLTLMHISMIYIYDGGPLSVTEEKKKKKKKKKDFYSSSIRLGCHSR